MRIKVDKNLYLKTLCMEDIDERLNIINSNRNFLRMWLGWVDSIRNLQDITVYTQNCIAEEKAGNGYTFGIYKCEKFIGTISIKDINYNHKKAEIGYWLDENSNGMGIMTKSCKKILDYCFKELQLHRIQILVATKNYPSQAIPERLNFKKEGILKDNECLYGNYVDNYIYSMLDDDWKKCKN